VERGLRELRERERLINYPDLRMLETDPQGVLLHKFVSDCSIARLQYQRCSIRFSSIHYNNATSPHVSLNRPSSFPRGCFITLSCAIHPPPGVKHLSPLSTVSTRGITTRLLLYLFNYLTQIHTHTGFGIVLFSLCFN
jgi:hypothetical protein